MMNFVRRLKLTGRRWQEDDGGLLAAAVAYYAALSFFPLVLVLISGVGFVMQFTQWGADSQQHVLAAIGDYASPQVEQSVSRMLEDVQRQAVVGGPVGLLALLFTAVTLFAHFERAFDRIWNIQSPESRGIWQSLKHILFHRLRAFLLLVGLGVVILLIFIAGVALASLRRYTDGVIPIDESVWRIMESGVSVVLNALVLCLIFKFLPKVLIRWPEAWRGAALTAVTWELGRLVLTLFIVGDKYTAYGVVGSFIAVMLWIYYAITVLFVGAEYIQVICEECDTKRLNANRPPTIPSSPHGASTTSSLQHTRRPRY